MATTAPSCPGFIASISKAPLPSNGHSLIGGAYLNADAVVGHLPNWAQSGVRVLLRQPRAASRARFRLGRMTSYWDLYVRHWASDELAWPGDEWCDEAWLRLQFDRLVG